MAATSQPRRRFVTRSQVEDAAASGTPLRLGARDVLTDEGAQRAREIGIEVVREDVHSGSAARSHSAPPASPRSRSASDDALRTAVQAAVAAELGTGTPGIDAAIDRVFARRRSSGSSR